MVWTLLFELNLKKIMKKQITYLFIYLIFLTTLQGQIVQERLPGAEEIINRSSPFNLEELKVRWKKAALENCPGVPCITSTVPGPPTTVTASVGNAQATISFTAPSSNGGSPITGYTVTSSPGGITATGATSPINVTGLTNGTPYTFTIVATNAIGNSVASSASTAVTPVAPVCPTSTVTDVDNNIYNTVAIGTQCWTKSNLKVTKYNDGTAIPDESANTAGWGAGGGALTTGALSDNTGVASFIATYGYLYNWYAAKGVSTSGSTTYKNICPIGWHVPTDVEWTALETQLGGFLVAGGKMKSMGTTLWNSPNTGADNSSGFSALPGGWRGSGPFGGGLDVKDNAYFWSATTDAATIGFGSFRSLDRANGVLNLSSTNKYLGYSIRCLKD